MNIICIVFIFSYFDLNECLLQIRKHGGIKHNFPFITIRKVPRELLKTEGEVFNTSRGTLQILVNDKITSDRYYCINSTKTLQK